DAFATINPDFKKVLTRSLGVSEAVSVTPRVIPLDHGDQILLCTDGLSNMITSQPTDLNTILHIADGPSNLVTALSQFLSKSNSKDHATVIAVGVIDETGGIGIPHVSIQEKVNCLKAIPMFKGIWGLPEELVKVASLLSVKEYKPGDHL